MAEEDKLTPGEIAANLLGAQGVTSCICVWIDGADRVTWYKMGSSLTAIGLLEVLRQRYMDECCEEDDDGDVG